MQNKKTTAILLSVLAAAFYAVNVPFSKLLLNQIGPTFLASLLYFGAGIGIGILCFSFVSQIIQGRFIAGFFLCGQRRHIIDPVRNKLHQFFIVANIQITG